MANIWNSPNQFMRHLTRAWSQASKHIYPMWCLVTELLPRPNRSCMRTGPLSLISLMKLSSNKLKLTPTRKKIRREPAWLIGCWSLRSMKTIQLRLRMICWLACLQALTRVEMLPSSAFATWPKTKSPETKWELNWKESWIKRIKAMQKDFGSWRWNQRSFNSQIMSWMKVCESTRQVLSLITTKFRKIVRLDQSTSRKANPSDFHLTLPITTQISGNSQISSSQIALILPMNCLRHQEAIQDIQWLSFHLVLESVSASATCLPKR